MRARACVRGKECTVRASTQLLTVCVNPQWVSFAWARLVAGRRHRITSSFVVGSFIHNVCLSFTIFRLPLTGAASGHSKCIIRVPCRLSVDARK